MIWVDGECEIAERITASVEMLNGRWQAAIVTYEDVLMVSSGHETEAAARAAVCHWIGKTMAQFSNALAKGCIVPDDGA